jgi:cytochrome oxidase Cu insertion factor (SCO1/SenC/PrrC family)
MEIRPISLKDANAYIIQNHRHHGKAQGHKFSLGVFDGSDLHGVAVVGRPVSRHLDDGMTCEVIRLCTDGTYNACSMLYSRCARVCKDMGYKKIITYILDSESGVSLKASGWTCDEKMVGGG